MFSCVPELEYLLPTMLGLRADFGYWLLALDKEALHKMEHFNLGLEGGYLTFLGGDYSGLLLIGVQTNDFAKASRGFAHINISFSRCPKIC